MNSRRHARLRKLQRRRQVERSFHRLIDDLAYSMRRQMDEQIAELMTTRLTAVHVDYTPSEGLTVEKLRRAKMILTRNDPPPADEEWQNRWRRIFTAPEDMQLSTYKREFPFAPAL